ncbi:kelch-like protein 10 [Stegodyphus dumicola]|uniref:kelch-like protein 10 n=1 Tax=Stegodyphus dumicola TaxID=202533 RepID=UPI0015A80E37|nr:kelch-like protein 10 [Stegodyphus dumicola]
METAALCLSEESIAQINSRCLETWTEMRESVLLPDAVLHTEDGGAFSIHKSIMSACSLYFKVLFTTKIDKRKRTRYTIPGITASMLQLIITYAYSGRTEVTDDNINKFLPAADQFNVLGIIDDCTRFLLYKMNYENCIGIRNFAQTFFCFELEDAANRFILSNFVDVVQESEEFLEMQVDELVLLLNSDRINVRNEEIVWEAGIQWVKHMPQERKKYVDAVMRCVRLGLLDTQYFMEKVKLHPFVENNESCKPIVIETIRFIWDLEMIEQKTQEVETPFLAIPRIPHSILFTIGGWSGGSPTNLVETYDTKADRWIRVPEADPSGPRAYHKLAVIGFDIYVIGGFDGNEYFNSCRCFNAVTKEWRNIAPMYSKRCYVSVATLDNLIYAMGGYDGHHRQNTAERYNYRTNQWSFITPMNIQRSDASASTLNGNIYVVGGFNGSECLSSSEFYCPRTDQWTLVQSMRNRRSGVSVISHHGSIFALGGFNGISRLVNGEKYDPETDQWTAIPDMFNPRSNFAVEVIDDMIFVIGGFNGVTTIFHVECFDEEAGEWYEATDMSTYRSALAACVIPGLPNVDDYIHKNRNGLLEEKRQKLIQQQAIEQARNRYQALEDGETDELDINEPE